MASLTGKLAEEEERFNSEDWPISGGPPRRGTRSAADAGYRDDLATTEKTLASKRKALRPIAIRQAPGAGKSDRSSRRATRTSRIWRCSPSSSNSLKAEIKSVARGKSDADRQDPGSATSSRRRSPRLQGTASQGRSGGRSPHRRAGGAPPNPDHRGCRPPTTQGRQETVRDDRADHASARSSEASSASLSSNCRPTRWIPPTKSRPSWGSRWSAPCRSLRGPSRPRQTGRARGTRRRIATGKTSCSNRSTRPGPCWCTRPAPVRTAW